MAWTEQLRAHVELAAQRALVEQDAGPYSPTTGCFDRRYWAWKLVDFPEATFQRLVLPLALLYRDPVSRLSGRPEVLAAVRAGLKYVARVQHVNGAFDQAFPWEQSYGATAFLLYPAIEAARLIDENLTGPERDSIATVARRAATFLCEQDERHGVIANHLAGAALGLVAAADYLREPRFDAAASTLLSRVLSLQSAEGWFQEYDGADPGYQTLCVDYLSALAERRPSARLDEALDAAIGFLKWFAHPDGTFGGSYGSRRTSLVYPAGLARLSARNPTAGALCELATSAMTRSDTVGVCTVDVGNLAPVLTSVVCALPHLRDGMGQGTSLPHCFSHAAMDFPEAGLYVRGTARYFAVCGASNGGTLTVFAKKNGRLALDDGGYVAGMPDGTLATTQSTDRACSVRATDEAIEIDVPFVRMPAMVPTPERFLLLRTLNLSVMRSLAVGNWIKRRLVARLIGRGRIVPLRLVRRVEFEGAGLRILDTIENPKGLAVRWLAGGIPFVGIHMASAGYFQAARLGTTNEMSPIDVAPLIRLGTLQIDRSVSTPVEQD